MFDFKSRPTEFATRCVRTFTEDSDFQVADLNAADQSCSLMKEGWKDVKKEGKKERMWDEGSRRDGRAERVAPLTTQQSVA